MAQTVSAKPKTMRVWDKGQVTIPTALRRDLNLDEGTIIYVQKAGDGLLLRPKESAISVIQQQGEKLMRKKDISLDNLINDTL